VRCVGVGAAFAFVFASALLYFSASDTPQSYNLRVYGVYRKVRNYQKILIGIETISVSMVMFQSLKSNLRILKDCLSKYFI